MKFRFAGPNHYLSRGELREPAKAFFPPLDPVKHALIAYDHTVGMTPITAGWFRFDTNGVKLWAAGTWVEATYRRSGLAYELWCRVIERFKPERLIVRTISEAGRKFAASIVGDNEDISFEVLT